MVTACAAGFMCAAAGASGSVGAVEAMLDVHLGFDNVSGFDTTTDVYCSAVVSDPCEVRSSSCGCIDKHAERPPILLHAQKYRRDVLQAFSARGTE